MADWIILVAAAAASMIGFAWLALAMQGHWEQVHGGAGPSHATKLTLRVSGIFGLLVSGTLCFIADRPSMAALLWIMLLAFGSLFIAFTLAWKPQALRFFWRTAGVPRRLSH